MLGITQKNNFMENNDLILKELAEIRNIFADLIGTKELTKKEKFSKEAIGKAAIEFKKLSTQKGKWINGREVSYLFKDSPYDTGNFIVENFEFTNYFIRGRSRLYNKKDILALRDELRKRNVDLAKYIELVRDKEKFQRYIDSAKKNKGASFTIPDELMDVQLSAYPTPSISTVQAHIKTLLEVFRILGFKKYIDLFENSTYALYKFDGSLDQLIDPETKGKCLKWCLDFNYANRALNLIKELPLKSDDEIEE